jgi:hypothetical protein
MTAGMILEVLKKYNQTLPDHTSQRKKLLIINNSGWWYRAKVNQYFQQYFNESNSYSFLKGMVTKNLTCTH